MQSVKGVLSGKTAERGLGVLRVHRSTQSADQPEFIPVGQAAKALGLSAMTVRRLYDAQELPGYRHGRTRQILRAFVDGFVAEIKTGRQPVLQDYAAAWFARADEGAA